MFREVLEYNSLTADLFGTAQQSGNIGQMLWQVKGRAAQAYGFTYDYLDRLTISRYSNYTAGGTIDPVDYYGESLAFDVRGNITGITRKGLVKGATFYTSSSIDNQTLSLQAGTNLTTQSTGTNSLLPTHASMDAPHNHLNLPSKFDFGSNNTIDLLYDGLGNKLRKTVKTNNVTTLTQDYLDGIELKNNKVDAVYNEEGRAFNTAAAGQTYRYEYALRDHLGNTRVVFTDKGAAGIQDQTEILGETHYYPFGKAMDGAWYNDATASKYRYLYNGKELNEEFSLNFYDYGARWLDPGIGSWWEVDPASEGNRRWSPFAYGNNNPVRFIDPDGRMTKDELMNWYQRQQLTSFADQSTGALGNSAHYGSDEVQNDKSRQDDGDQKTDNAASGGDVSSKSETDPFNFHDPINDPLIGVKAMSGLFELTGIVGIYRGFRAGLITTMKWAIRKSGYKIAAKGGLTLESSVSKVMGKTYEAAGEVIAPIKNAELLNSLNAASKGNWVKVYEAGLQNGSKIETHYFRNNTTGQVFDVKTKYNYWYQKSFKNLIE